MCNPEPGFLPLPEHCRTRDLAGAPTTPAEHRLHACCIRPAVRNSWGAGWGMGGYGMQAAGCNAMGVAQGGNSASIIQPKNPHPPPGVPPPPGIPPPPPHPPAAPPPPVHPDILPKAKIKLLDRDYAFDSSAASLLNVTDAMSEALEDEQDRDPRLGGPDGFTFSGWVRRANYGSLTDTIFQLGSYTVSDDGQQAVTASDTITLSFGDGAPAHAGRRLSSGPAMRYTVQNGGDPSSASGLDISRDFPPWVWVHISVVHEEDGTAKVYYDNDLVASGAVTLPAKVFRSSHVFGGTIDASRSTLFRGVLHDVFITAAAIDEHHRNHVQTHTGPEEGWQAAYLETAAKEACPAYGCQCSATPSGRRLGEGAGDLDGDLGDDLQRDPITRVLKRIPYGERMARPHGLLPSGATPLSIAVESATLAPPIADSHEALGKNASDRPSSDSLRRRQLQGVPGSIPNTPCVIRWSPNSCTI